jgi:hypothetical protein
VTGKQLMRRVVTVFFAMLCLFVFLHAVDADAQEGASSELSAMSQSFLLPSVGLTLSVRLSDASTQSRLNAFQF